MAQSFSSFVRSAVAVGALFFASCGALKLGPGPVSPKANSPQAARPEDIVAADEFFKKGGKGGFHPASDAMKPLTPESAAFVVELDQQRAYLYDGPQLIAVSKIASGRKYYRTETGEFVLGQKDLNHRSTLYGNFVSTGGGTMMSDVTNGFDPLPPGAKFQGSLMKYFQRFDTPAGKPTAMGFHTGVLPGYPASHGCVRLPNSMAEWFFKNVPAGARVTIRGEKNGVPYGSKQNRPKRSPKVHPSLQKKEPDAANPAPQTPPAGAEGAAMPAAPAAGAGGAIEFKPAAEAPAPAPGSTPAVPPATGQ